MFEGSETKKCKGVKKAVVKTELDIEDYKKCVFGDERKIVSFNTLRSRKHEITTETITKIAIDGKDDKCIVCENKIDTLAIVKE